MVPSAVPSVVLFLVPSKNNYFYCFYFKNNSFYSGTGCGTFGGTGSGTFGGAGTIHRRVFCGTFGGIFSYTVKE